ncbi:MAG: RDD family protein [Bdellovibrionales bacterium]|nr:RDD family protein [Bdellovibrionales bacterium]
MDPTREHPSTESSSIDFRPLHSGVGFHPFADGLPYAPAMPARNPQTNLSKGAGAVAAGAPRPVLTPRRSAPIPQAAQQPVPLAPVTLASPKIEKNFSIAYPVVRAVAFAFDLGFNFTLIAISITLGLALVDVEPWFLLEPGIFGFTALFLFALSWALIAFQEVLLKTTVGKRMVGLKLRGSPGTILLRSFLFLPSCGFFCVGLLWSLFDRDKRCWHDVAADLQPTRVTQL